MPHQHTEEAVTALIKAWSGEDPQWGEIPAYLLTVLAWILESEPGEA